jgi:hypothetical protein
MPASGVFVNPQDIAIGAFIVVVLFTLAWGTSGPRHRGVHNILVLVAVMTPLVSFDLSRAAEIPAEVWVFCAGYFCIHAVSSAYHYIWPDAIHARSTEAIAQVTFPLWATGIRMNLDPSLWYRGDVGTVLFCVATIWVTLVVLVTVYQSELTSHARDEFDFFKYPLKSKSNAGILTATPSTFFLALYVALGSPWLIAGALASWTTMRLMLPPDPATT